MDFRQSTHGMRASIQSRPKMRTVALLAAAICAASALTACGKDGPTGPDTRVASVSVSAPSAQILAAGTGQLSAAARNAAGETISGRSFDWSSSNDAVAEVNGSGLVSGNSEGQVTITATETGSAVSGTIVLTIGPAAVHGVSLSPTTVSLAVGETEQIAAELTDSRGEVLTGRAVSWSSSNPDVASVSETGLVRAEAAGGPVTITATSEGRNGTAQVTVEAIPVASVGVSPASATIEQAGSEQLTAVVRDASGNELTDRGVEWSSSDTSIATVDQSGLVNALAAGGPVSITATSEGQSGTAEITVVARTATRVAVAPRFVAIDVGETSTLGAEAFDAADVAIPDPNITWTSTASGVASVSDDGALQGAGVGQTSVTAQVNAAVDSAWVAVLGSASLLSTAFVGEQPKTAVERGETFTVPVVLDLSKVSTDGDLGSVQLDLQYDAAVLVYEGAESGLSGSASHNVASPGVFKFSFAGTSPQGAPDLTLVTVTFRVASDAAAGTERPLTVEYTAAPTSTEFEAYSMPISVDGRIVVSDP